MYTHCNNRLASVFWRNFGFGFLVWKFFKFFFFHWPSSWSIYIWLGICFFVLEIIIIMIPDTQFESEMQISFPICVEMVEIIICFWFVSKNLSKIINLMFGQDLLSSTKIEPDSSPSESHHYKNSIKKSQSNDFPPLVHRYYFWMILSKKKDYHPDSSKIIMKRWTFQYYTNNNHHYHHRNKK